MIIGPITLSIGQGTEQPDSTFELVHTASLNKFELTGFIDAYYSYDFGKPTQGFRQPFFFNHNRHNEFNINLALLEFSYETDNYHAFIGLQAGTYANDNYANESSTLKNLSEAYVGIALDKRKSLWLDAGLFGSHLGFESAVSADNWTLTRSLVAENSPFFLTGAKLTYIKTPGGYPRYGNNNRFKGTLVISNGWQRIARVQGSSLLSVGTQLEYRISRGKMPLRSTTFNWSTFIGSDDPDVTRRMRFFNNLYVKSDARNKFGFIAGLDFGFQQESKGSANYDKWVGPVLIAKYQLCENWALGLRGEYYGDESGVIIATGTANGFKTTGLSFNLDHEIEKDVHFRVETRWLKSQDKIFERPGNGFHGDNLFMTASITAKFNK